MSNSPGVSSARSEQAVLTVFADLTRFMVNSRGTPAGTLAELLDGYYRHAESLVSTIGGRVVRFMGDAFLAVWPEERAAAGVAALPGLKGDIDAWWAARGWDSRVVVKAHFGRAVTKCVQEAHGAGGLHPAERSAALISRRECHSLTREAASWAMIRVRARATGYASGDG